MSDVEREALDAHTQLFVKAAIKRIELMSAMAAKLESLSVPAAALGLTSQTGFQGFFSNIFALTTTLTVPDAHKAILSQHRTSILWILQKRLKDVSSIQREMQQKRLELTILKSNDSATYAGVLSPVDSKRPDPRPSQNIPRAPRAAIPKKLHGSSPLAISSTSATQPDTETGSGWETDDPDDLFDSSSSSSPETETETPNNPPRSRSLNRRAPETPSAITPNRAPPRPLDTDEEIRATLAALASFDDGESLRTREGELSLSNVGAATATAAAEAVVAGARLIQRAGIVSAGALSSLRSTLSSRVGSEVFEERKAGDRDDGGARVRGKSRSPERRTDADEGLRKRKKGLKGGPSRTRPLVEEDRKSVAVEAQLSPLQLMALESENAELLASLESDLDQVRSATQSLAEISSLQTQLSQHLAAQDEIITTLHEEAIESTETMKLANLQLRSAKKHMADSRWWVIVFLLCASGTLLFLDWYSG
ncbi:hypothetical protein BJ742DRAFT_834182 [Cladochytrium replicatum]|nr:hypothetical protein BJ742DRAFT_834182 [Cladochytrium replicatum]